MKKIAIIGSGITGCTLAVNLKEYDITIFDKSRGVGGRLATRRADNFVFDHGAPFFQIKTKEFYNFLKPQQNTICKFKIFNKMMNLLTFFINVVNISQFKNSQK